MLRRGAFGLSAAVERRQWKYLQRQFGALSISDHRFSRDERILIAQKIVTPHSCCSEPGIPRFLNERANGDLMVLIRLSMALHYIACFIFLSLGCIERLHKQNKDVKAGNKDMGIACYTAKSFFNQMSLKFKKFMDRIQRKQAEKERLEKEHVDSFGLGRFAHYKCTLNPYEVLSKHN